MRCYDMEVKEFWFQDVVLLSTDTGNSRSSKYLQILSNGCFRIEQKVTYIYFSPVIYYAVSGHRYYNS